MEDRKTLDDFKNEVLQVIKLFNRGFLTENDAVNMIGFKCNDLLIDALIAQRKAILIELSKK